MSAVLVCFEEGTAVEGHAVMAHLQSQLKPPSSVTARALDAEDLPGKCEPEALSSVGAAVLVVSKEGDSAKALREDLKHRGIEVVTVYVAPPAAEGSRAESNLKMLSRANWNEYAENLVKAVNAALTSAAADHREEPAPTTAATPSTRGPRVLIPLHGIRTRADWQKALSDLAQMRVGQDGRAKWICTLRGWSFGYFPFLWLLMPWLRNGKAPWFLRQYEATVLHRDYPAGTLPSVVAHSFGTYILASALERYPYLHFDRVVLCGSILPRSFDWSKYIKNGQVRAVRNEPSTRDIWCRLAPLAVGETGRSGTRGFCGDWTETRRGAQPDAWSVAHSREQETFKLAHSEMFSDMHMSTCWFPFLERPLEDSATGMVRPNKGGKCSDPSWPRWALLACILAAAALFLWGRRDCHPCPTPLKTAWDRAGDLRDSLTRLFTYVHGGSSPKYLDAQFAVDLRYVADAKPSPADCPYPADYAKAVATVAESASEFLREFRMVDGRWEIETEVLKARIGDPVAKALASVWGRPVLHIDRVEVVSLDLGRVGGVDVHLARFYWEVQARNPTVGEHTGPEDRGSPWFNLTGGGPESLPGGGIAQEVTGPTTMTIDRDFDAYGTRREPPRFLFSVYADLVYADLERRGGGGLVGDRLEASKELHAGEAWEVLRASPRHGATYDLALLELTLHSRKDVRATVRIHASLALDPP